MRTPLLLAATGALVFAACRAADPARDRDDLHADVARRTARDLPAPPHDLATAAGDEVLALLRAPLSEDAAVRIALLNNHGVRATYERLGVARADLVQAGLLRNPVFDADARFLFDGGTELELGLAQPFVDLFWRPLRERLAEHEFAAARALITAELVQLVFAVRRAFVDVRATDQRADVQRQALVAAEAAHELALTLHAAGNATDQALAIERAGETRARLELHAAELAAHEAKEPLQRLLGLWGEHAAWTIEGALPDDPLDGVDLQRIESRVIQNSLELAAHRAHVDALAQHVGLADWRGWLPDGAVGLSAIREPGGDWGLGPRVVLELPLFDDGTTAHDRSSRQLRAGVHDHVQLAVELRSAARTLRDRAYMLAEAVRFQRDVHLPQRAEVLRATQQTYNAMQIGAFDVLMQRRLQLQDTAEHVATLRLAWLARLDLQQLLAGSLPAAMLAPLPSLPATADSHSPNREHR